MDDLLAFVEARNADDEQAARSAAEHDPPPWSAEYGLVSHQAGVKAKYSTYRGDALWDNEGAGSLSMEPATADHVARQDPARTLARCAAQRRIIGRAKVWLDGDPADGTHSEQMARTIYTDTLKTLATVWSDHPDYRQEWVA